MKNWGPLLVLAACQPQGSDTVVADAGERPELGDAQPAMADAAVGEGDAGAMGCAAAYGEAGPAAVGVTTIEVDGNPVEVWYPAAAPGDVRDRYDMRAWLPADAAAAIPDDAAPWHETDAYRDVPWADGRAPLVLFSHGLAGYRMQSTFLMTHLASWGFVVAAPEHAERGLAVILETGAPTGDDAAAALAATRAALAEHPHVDADLVASGGHSMGTTAALSMAAETDAWFALAGAGFGAGPDRPFLLMAGTHDGLARPDLAETAYDQQPGPRRYVAIEGAGHLAFTDICVIGADRGGVLAIAIAHGVEIPDFIVNLASDGCRADDLPADQAWPLVRHYVTAHLRHALALDAAPRWDTDCYDDRLATVLDDGAGPPTSADAGPAADTGPGADGSPTPDAGLAPDAGADPEPDAGEPDPGDVPDPEAGVVQCGPDTTCDLDGNLCCVGVAGYTCRAGGACDPFEAPQACDGPEDCDGGDICCVGFPQGAQCGGECGAGQQQLCHDDDDCAGVACQVCAFPGGSARICAERCP